MRILVAGGGSVGRRVAEEFVEEGHTIVVVDKDSERCQMLTDSIDAVVIHGDASKPDVLEQAEITSCDCVIAATACDQDNLIVMVIAREHNVKQIIVRFEDPAFNSIAQMLGVQNIINPKIAAAQRIVNLARGQHLINLSSVVRGNARLYTTTIHQEEHIDKLFSELNLPKETLPIGLYRREEFLIPTEDIRLLEDDRITLLTQKENISKLEELFD